MFRASLSNLSKAFTSSFSPVSRFNFASTSSYYVQQFNTACLAEFAYYVESNGEAAIIDPLREIKPYLELAKSRNAKIKYVFETHFHADFVSGHVDLARETGAKIIYGPNAQAKYDMYSAKDGEQFSIGDIALKVLHTPGHTLESSCYLLLDESRKPTTVFTGDTLFLGEVGRPDLAVASELKKEDLAGMMYDSLRTKLMTLDDNVVVYPAHGAGSSCGKNISKGSSCTIGNQKKTNYALQDMAKEDFVKIVASDLAAPPKYFFHDAAINKTGYTSFDEVMKKNLQPLSFSQVKDLKSQGAILVDCRDSKNVFETGLIPGSVAISLGLPFAVWAGTLLSPSDKLVIVAEPGKEEEAVVRLARVGFENCAGYLKGGVQEWKSHNGTLEKIDTIEGKTYSKDLKEAQTIRVLDVRNKPEWDIGVFPDSVRIPLGQLEGRVNELKKDQPYHIMCKAGVRAVVAYSILKRNGFDNLTVIKGGADQLTEGGFKLEELKN